MGEDLATGACGVANACYFAGLLLGRNGARGRRVAALVLLLVNVVAVAEALLSEGLFWAEHGGLGAPPAGVWVLTRLPLLVATALATAIIARNVLS